MVEIREHAVKINEGIRMQEARACFLCGSEGVLLYQDLHDRLFSSQSRWELLRCPKCGLVWINPRPLHEELSKLYEHYYTHNSSNFIPRLASLRRMIRDAILATSFSYNSLPTNSLQKGMGRVCAWIGPIREMVEIRVRTLNGERRGKLLDVGCGNGEFLAMMRYLGWEVMGVEPDEEAVKVAHEQFGLSVYKGTLEEAGFPDDMFDAITMNHVIEHVFDPISTFKEVLRVLKHGGRLVVLTPNVESLGHRLFGKAWFHLDPPRHLHLFSPYTLQTCFEQAGLMAFQLRTTACSARWIWVASRFIQRNGFLPAGSPSKQGLWLRLEGLIFQGVEHGLCWMRNAGEEVVLIATK